MVLAKELLDILACPKCKGGGVTLLDDESALVCAACAKAYPILNGIPVMLIDEAGKFGEK
jgi:hypothetical protein